MLVKPAEREHLLAARNGKALGEPPTQAEGIVAVVVCLDVVVNGNLDASFAVGLDICLIVESDIHACEGEIKMHRVGKKLCKLCFCLLVFTGEDDAIQIAVDRLLAAGEANVGIVFEEHMGSLRNHAVRQLGAGCGKISANAAAVDGDGDDIVTDVCLPILGNACHAVEDTEGCANGCRGAVGVVAAVDRGDHRFLEVALAVEQTEDRVSNVGGCLEPAVSDVGVSLLNEVSCLHCGNTLFIAFDRKADGICHAAMRGDEIKTDVDATAEITDDERGRLHCGNESGGISTLARAVVDLCVLDRVFRGNMGAGGSHTSPDLGTDPSAVGMLPIVVVVACERRDESSLHVDLTDAVFVPMRGEEAEPELAQGVGGNGTCTDALNGVQPNELQIEVIVGENDVCLGGVSLDIQNLVRSLEGTAHRAADVLTNPASIDLVLVFFSIESDFDVVFHIKKAPFCVFGIAVARFCFHYNTKRSLFLYSFFTF